MPTANRPATTIFWAGLTAGVMDITAAFLTGATKGVTPGRILQYVASGLLGPKSYDGGWPTAALGLACHFFVAFSAATVFYLASRKLTFLTRHALLSGALYGISVYLVMYWIVKPLSHVRPSPFSWSPTVVAILTHIVCVGTPIALVVRRFEKSDGGH